MLFRSQILYIPPKKEKQEKQDKNILNINDNLENNPENNKNIELLTINTNMPNKKTDIQEKIISSKVSNINLKCSCGYEANNQKQILKHKIKCNIEIQNRDNTNSCVCQYCKKILSNKFSCERHMLKCKKIIDNTNPEIEVKNKNNKNNKKIIDVEQNLLTIKNFITIFESGGEDIKKSILENKTFKQHLQILLDY